MKGPAFLLILMYKEGRTKEDIYIKAGKGRQLKQLYIYIYIYIYHL